MLEYVDDVAHDSSDEGMTRRRYNNKLADLDIIGEQVNKQEKNKSAT
jgi:hypothetical protein